MSSEIWGLEQRLTFCRAILVSYQRLIFPPPNLRGTCGPWYHAVQRCLDACDSMSEVIRALSDADLENVSPHLIFCIFVAARFFIGQLAQIHSRSIFNLIKPSFSKHARILATEIPPRLNLLIYGLKVCGQRWHFASQFNASLPSSALDNDYRKTRKSFTQSS